MPRCDTKKQESTAGRGERRERVWLGKGRSWMGQLHKSNHIALLEVPLTRTKGYKNMHSHKRARETDRLCVRAHTLTHAERERAPTRSHMQRERERESDELTLMTGIQISSRRLVFQSAPANLLYKCISSQHKNNFTKLERQTDRGGGGRRVYVGYGKLGSMPMFPRLIGSPAHWIPGSWDPRLIGSSSSLVSQRKQFSLSQARGQKMVKLTRGQAMVKLMSGQARAKLTGGQAGPKVAIVKRGLTDQ